MIHGAVPLVAVRRGDCLESVHWGWGVVVDAQGEILMRWGSPVETFARSTLKPLQCLPLVRTGTADRFQLSPQQLALCASSHAGEAFHVNGILSMLENAGLSEAALSCGTHPPLNEAEANRLRVLGEEPRPVHHNCSGKHTGMLMLALHQGWSLEDYLDIEHPVQQAIGQAISEITGETLDVWAPDGCGAPIWHFSLDALALAYARLDGIQAGRRILDAMASHPASVAGTGRLDTRLMEAASGKIVAKSGGEGIHAGVIRDRGIGWAVKVSDGNRRALPPAVLGILARLGLDLPLADLKRPLRSNHRGETIGVLEWMG